ncbi:glutathione S-transferase N-terminal domain-containing protein [Sulfitobacter sp. F26204]|uniref:glutathione S-transferase family protein n=1 Tax=Sulfitobacter sp. F26204 TaxID=2996014 RepID=UPI00225E624F|nr:glutathione S-transferase N-terminal domain-containing protein [Sulfitobacter sp. F26204]MCX7558548.1 glutathione S-transferase N-terminal domain-containing protein [Sulfitobacter sp. F26204]
MADLSAFPITKRWPAQDPDVVQLYSFPTPNGVKIAIALEEMDIPYEAHRVTLADADVKSPEFLSLNPNNKIPAIIDPNGPNGEPIGLFESGAILIYLAEKTGKFIGSSASERAHVIQWLMFQMGGLGPMLGQLGFFYKFAGSEWEDKRPQQRYLDEAGRLLNVLNLELAGKDWITGAYSIADMAIAPWLRALDFYGAKDVLHWEDHKNLVAYLDRFSARSAVQKGLFIPPRD